MELQPRASDIRRRFGDVLLSAGEFRRAIEEYRKSVSLGDRRSAWVAYSAAVASIKPGDRDAEMRWIEQFKDVAPLRTRLAGDAALASLHEMPRFQEIAGGEAGPRK